jgi:hypothetical protein
MHKEQRFKFLRYGKKEFVTNAKSFSTPVLITEPEFIQRVKVLMYLQLV